MKPNNADVYFALLRSDFKVFLRRAFKTIYPGKPFLDNWHIDAIIYCLRESIEGRMTRLIINLPPRHLKSFIVSVALPAFVLGIDESAKIICVSYSDDLAKALSRDFSRIVNSDWYRQIFPHVRHLKKSEGEFVTEAGGGRYATSVGGSLTGRGADFIIIDDPIKAADVHHEKGREATNEWYRNTLLSRLDDKARGVLILVMQRLHVHDLTGFMEMGGGFHKLSFPAIALENQEFPVSSTAHYFRRAGEALHEEWEGLSTLEKIRTQIGSQNFLSQYQQSPETPEGGMFRLEWFQFVNKYPEISPGGKWFISIDTATSTSESADFSVIIVTYMNKEGYFVMGVERGHWTYEELKARALHYMKVMKQELYFIIECVGVGMALCHALQASRANVYWYQPKDGKLTRESWAVSTIEAGRVFIVNIEGNNKWVKPYVDEFVMFPHGRFDDQVDSMVQLLNWAERRFNPGADYFRQNFHHKYGESPQL
jgi:predicted phage terminase large subunit-like protein